MVNALTNPNSISEIQSQNAFVIYVLENSTLGGGFSAVGKWGKIPDING
jgi:hypothetical protein